MKHITTFFTILAFSIFITSCDIERAPYGSMRDEEIKNNPNELVDALLNGAYAQLKTWSNDMHYAGEFAGDNMMIRGSSTGASYEFISYSRTQTNYYFSGIWDTGYRAIAQTSNIIDMISEGVDAETDNKLGEAYFIRGMMYFHHVRIFGRPYYDNPTTNLGVPIVNGTPEDIFGKLPDRSSVHDTYQQAINDLEKAISLFSSNKGNIRGSKEAAQAILSRIYLFMSGTFESPNKEYAELSVKYSKMVIDSGKFSLLPREDFMKYNTFTPENNSETIFAIKRVSSEFSGNDHHRGVGGKYANIGGLGYAEVFSSAKFLSLLNESGRNDWYNGKIVDARAAFIEPQYEDSNIDVFRFIVNTYNDNKQHVNFDYIQAPITISGNSIICKEGDDTYTLKEIDKGQGIYSIDYKDGNTYQGVLDKLMKLNRAYPMFWVTKCSREGEESHLHSPVISRLGEIYLNIAEAEAKIGNYEEAKYALNIVRERSLPGKGYDELNESNAKERIMKERQLELAYQAERVYDIYRNGDSLSRKYPGPHNAMEVIPATDFRVVYYIPQSAINAYRGSGSTLTQNPTSN